MECKKNFRPCANLYIPQRFAGGGHRLRAGVERRKDILLVLQQAAGDDRLAHAVRHALQHARLRARQQVDRVRVRALPQYVFKRERIEQEKALDGQQPQALGMTDDVGPGGNDAVRRRVLRDEVGADILPSSPRSGRRG